ncbi:MAG: hypothetical protein OFPII_29510 [Osedax symbiont Rs1]|nr:MAG: hypothetical protein OFPII_29510 [Osedax symbiont Rs1]
MFALESEISLMLIIEQLWHWRQVSVAGQFSRRWPGYKCILLRDQRSLSSILCPLI